MPDWQTDHKLQQHNIMAILSKGTTFSSGQSVTANDLNALVDSANFVAGGSGTTDNTTLEVHSSGYLQVKDGGITNGKLAAGAVNASSLADGTITVTQLADNAVTTPKIKDSTGATDGVTTAKIADGAVTAAKISATDTTFNVGTNVAIGAVAGSTFKFDVTGSTGNVANFQANAAGGTAAIFVRNTSATGLSSILQLVAQSDSGSSYSKNLNLDLNSSSNTLQTAFGTGDQIGVALLNSNGGSGSETGAYYPTFDNKTTLGLSGKRWSVVYAGTATINTSDRNLKEEIQDLSDAELRVAQACKGLVKRFKFKGGTRKHIGVIAQDVRDAFTAEGLDAHEYGLFCSDTWTDEETGEEVTQLGIRYEELLAFIITAL